MKKFIIFVIKWSALILYLVLILSFVKQKRKNLICSELNIEIIGTDLFIDTTDVKKMLTTNGVYVDSIPLYSINFDKLEKLISQNEVVEYAEVFADKYGILNIIITQRLPLFRVVASDESGFYIDVNGEKMPLSTKHTAHVPVLNGYVTDEFVESLKTDSITSLLASQKYDYTLYDVYEMLSFMKGHELWNAQVQQIFVNENKEIEIVPVVGNHIIVLGSVNDYENKLWKMEALYKKGMNMVEWNAYKEINLKFSNQVICSR